MNNSSAISEEVDWHRRCLLKVEQRRRELLHLPIALRPAADYQAESTGKRMRPTILLCFALLGQDRPQPTPALISSAAAVELIHEASLIHDDVLDHSTIRRGRSSIPEKFGVATASHLGAYMAIAGVAALAEACELEGAALDLKVLRIMSQAQLEEGLDPLRNLTAQRNRCERVIQGKTGSLFELAARQGAEFAKSKEHRTAAARAAGPFSEHLALAFQLSDDLADLQQAPHLRKPGGGDLMQGIPNLVIQMWSASMAEPLLAWERLDQCRGQSAAAEALRREIANSNVPDRIRQLIRDQLDAARAILDELPRCPARQMLQDLLDKLDPVANFTPESPA